MLRRGVPAARSPQHPQARQQQAPAPSPLWPRCGPLPAGAGAPVRAAPGPTSTCSRRQLLSGALLLLAGQGRPLPAAAAEEQAVLRVGPGQAFATIAAAVQAAPAGARVLIEPGRYDEQLVLTRSIVLEAAAGAVELVCDSRQPYLHCLELPAGSDAHVQARGLALRHYSKSVANNYAVFVQGGGRLVLVGCEVSSRSGAGVGVEGGELLLQRCTVAGCERHGVAVFGSLEGGVGRCEVKGCTIRGNRLNGVLARDGAELVMRGSSVTDNGGHGVRLQDCKAQLSGNRLTGNGAGALALDAATTDADLRQLEAENELDAAGVQLL